MPLRMTYTSSTLKLEARNRNRGAISVACFFSAAAYYSAEIFFISEIELGFLEVLSASNWSYSNFWAFFEGKRHNKELRSFLMF